MNETVTTDTPKPKGRMKHILIGLVAVLVIALFAITISLDGMVRKGVETFAPKILGVPVTVKGVSISLFSGKTEIEDLVIGNPEGYKSGYAFSLKKVAVKLNVGSLLSDTIVIDSVLVDSPALSYEVRGGKSNISAIQEYVNASSSAEGKDAAPAKEEAGAQSSEGGKKVVITDLLIKNTRATVTTGLMDKIAAPSVVLPEIHMTDIGKEEEGGTSFADVASTIVSEITAGIAKVDLKGVADTLASGMKNAGETAGKAVKGAGQAVGTAVEGVGSAIKGLFGSE